MKTSGFREIDFTKIECKNCGEHSSINLYVPTGKILLQFNLVSSQPYMGFSNTIEHKLVDCPKCNGTGYTDETGIELELE